MGYYMLCLWWDIEATSSVSLCPYLLDTLSHTMSTTSSITISLSLLPMVLL